MSDSTYLSIDPALNLPKIKTATIVSEGIASGGNLVALRDDGTIDPSLLPAGTGSGGGGADMIRYATLLSGRAASTSVAATWDSAAKGTYITLGAGNLVAARTSASGSVYQCARATRSLSGKIYWEIKSNQPTGAHDDTMGLGISTAAATPLNDATQYLGYNAAAIGAWDWNGVYTNNAFVMNSPSTTTSPWTQMFAFDATTRELWMGDTDNGWWNGDPALGTSPIITMPSGTYYPVICFGPYVNSTIKANFGADAWAGSIPSGFTGLHS